MNDDVLAYAVAQRRREIGVRMALGAVPKQIGNQFLSLGLRLLGAGTILGVIGAWLLAAETPQTTRWGAACAGAIAALAIVGVLVGLRDGTVHGVATWSDRLRQANVLATWRVQPDSALRTLFPSAEYVRAFAPELERRRLSVFRAESR